MIIDAVSDLHGETPPLEGGDLLIIAGDLTANDSRQGYDRFLNWFTRLDYDCKVIVPGNHDCRLQNDSVLIEMLRGWVLIDQGIDYRGLKIWGSPWTFRFTGINPHCAAFTKRKDRELKDKWDLIPDDTDILVTHSPPYGILDESKHRERFGCLMLKEAVARVKPAFHFFGHIHEGHGTDADQWEPEGWITKYFNCAILDGDYEAVNKPTRVILDVKDA